MKLTRRRWRRTGSEHGNGTRMQPRPERSSPGRHLVHDASVSGVSLLTALEAAAFTSHCASRTQLVQNWSWSSPSTWNVDIFPLSESLTGSGLAFTSTAFRMKRLMVNMRHRASRPGHRNAGPGSAPKFRRAGLFPPPVFAVGFVRGANRCGIQSYQPGRFRELFQVLNFNLGWTWF